LATQIFLSYRREDSSAWAGRLRDALTSRVGEENVFQDVVGVQPGQNFTAAIDGALRRSNAVLVVIGPNWLTTASADGLRRLSDEHDHVRAELSAALRLGGLVIPVLVGRGAMPNPDQLPDELKSLALLQAVTLRDETWSHDVEGLFQAIGVPSRRARTRRLAIAAVAVIALLAGAAIGAVLLRSENPDDSTADDASTTPADLAASTTFDRSLPLPECTTPAVADDWNQLVADGAREIGPASTPSARTEVVEGRYRDGEDDRWDVLLAVDYTALTDGTQYQNWWYYQLTNGGLRVDPSCFSVTGGQEPACCGEVSEVLIGFEVGTEPAIGTALLIDDGGNHGRIELAPN